MISIDEVEIDTGVDLAKQETIEFQLTEEHQALLYSLDADVEAAAAFRRPGEMFEVSVTREIPASVVSALKRTWEAGGWVVGAFEIVDSETGRPVREREGYDDEHVFRLVFARPHKQQRVPFKNVIQALETRRQAEEFVVPDAATVDRIASGGRRSARSGSPLLIRMPTRSRPQQALEVLTKYREMATEHVTIEVIIDEDDVTCNNTQFLQQLADLDCVVTVGRHKSKIEACNGGRVADWDVLMLASDDMVPLTRGYDQRILAAFEKHFPLFDGSINFNDGYNRDHVRDGEPITCTLPILGRHLYDDYGSVVYWPQYKSIYCDTDQSFLFNKMNRMVFVDEVIVEHRHPAAGKAALDELYQFNTRHDDHDRMLFEERRARGFDAPKLVLSILICAIPSRRQQLERLVDYLRWQMRAHPQQVEICVDFSMDCTVGEKRQRLLERAVGKNICFVDDDDWIHNSFVTRVLKACAEGKDCCSLVGVITENGEDPRRFEHSMSNSGWYTREDGVYIRTVNHLNCVKRDLALKAGFVSQNVGEDHLYANALVPLLKSEADTGDSVLYYYWSVPAKSVQQGVT